MVAVAVTADSYAAYLSANTKQLDLLSVFLSFGEVILGFW